MKYYNIQYNIGKVKYIVNFSDGIAKHTDGSLFYDIHIFKNKIKLNNFVKYLKSLGYIYK